MIDDDEVEQPLLFQPCVHKGHLTLHACAVAEVYFVTERKKRNKSDKVIVIRKKDRWNGTKHCLNIVLLLKYLHMISLLGRKLGFLFSVFVQSHIAVLLKRIREGTS